MRLQDSCKALHSPVTTCGIEGEHRDILSATAATKWKLASRHRVTLDPERMGR